MPEGPIRELRIGPSRCSSRTGLFSSIEYVNYRYIMQRTQISLTAAQRRALDGDFDSWKDRELDGAQ